MSRKAITNLALALAIVAIFAVSFLVGGSAAVNRDNPDERFSGTDNKATSQIQQLDPHYTPWFSSLFEPASGEVESGLFAMQAAIGGVVLGFAFGALWGRRNRSGIAARTADDPAPTIDSGTAGTTEQ